MNPEKSRGRILMIGLDGFELSLAETMMAEGNLPNFARLRSQSARYLLDHGRDKYSGISWEHVSTGLSPTDGGRWSSVSFDPVSYGVHQETTSMTPFVADASGQTVVFDVPYFDLARAPRVRGMTNWGAHDPGVPTTSRPAGLQDELRERFGPLPAEAETLLHMAHLRVLGAALGLQHVLIRGDEARLTFRPGTQPRLTGLTSALDDVQLAAEVRRTMPLSLHLLRLGGEPIVPALVRALQKAA